MSIKNFCSVRLGNKQKDIQYFCHLLPKQEDVDAVGEPFAGSFAVIRNCYYNVPTIYCADNDLQFKKTIDNRLKHLPEYYEFNKKYKEFTNTLMITEKGKKFISAVNKPKVKEWINENKGILEIDFERDLMIRGLITQPSTKLNYDNLANLYNRIIWSDDFKTVLNALKDNESGFVFLDPPYLSSNNNDYYGNISSNDNNINDNTGLFIDIMNFFKTAKCKVMLIINKNAINEYIMNGYIKHSYSKRYGISQRKEQLMVCTNYEL